MKRFAAKHYADGGDVSEENPERVARNAAEMAKKRAAILAKKAEQKRILAEARPQIEAARAAREAAAERNAAMAGGLSNADITSAVSKAMYSQGASEADRQAALRNITSAMQTGPRDVRGNTDIGSIMKAVGQYATPDQLNAALKASGRQGTFNAFDTYNTGVSGATQSLNDLIAARDASAGIGIKKPVMPVMPMQPEMPALPAPVPQPVTSQPFDPNAALQTFNKRAAELNASGKGLFNSGMSPDEFRMHQGILRNLQLNPNSTPEQHADILNKSMAFLNQYSGATPQPMNGSMLPVVNPNTPYRPTGPDAFYADQPEPTMTRTAPAPSFMPPPQPRMVTAPGGSAGFDERTGTYMRPRSPFSSLFNLRFPMSGGASTGGLGGILGGARMTPANMPQGPVTPMPYNPINTTTEEDMRGRPGSGMPFRGLSGMFSLRPGQGSFVNTMPMAQADPNFRFGETTQQMAPNAQGMALGGLMAKYRGGEC